jgi:hypothetical protein
MRASHTIAKSRHGRTSDNGDEDEAILLETKAWERIQTAACRICLSHLTVKQGGSAKTLQLRRTRM